HPERSVIICSSIGYTEGQAAYPRLRLDVRLGLRPFLIRRHVFTILPLFCALAVASAESTESQFGVNQTLFATLAAINAAGYDAGIDSPLNDHYQLRTQIRKILASRQLECLPELRAFYKEHKRPTGAGDLGQYISFAITAGEAPKFAMPSGEVPPDVE